MRLLLMTILLATCAFVGACNKPTAGPTASDVIGWPAPSLENYDKIEVGMTLHQVEAILGPPDTTATQDAKLPDGSTKKEITGATWKGFKVYIQRAHVLLTEPERSIHVDLADGKVTAKEQTGLK